MSSKLALCLVATVLGLVGPVRAGTAKDPTITAIKQQLDAQAKAIAAQNGQLAIQRHLIELLEKRLSVQDTGSRAAVATVPPQTKKLAQTAQPSYSSIQNPYSAGGAAIATADTTKNPQAVPNLVGQAPEGKDRPPEIQTIASVGGVLTPSGAVVVEPYAEYVHTSLNQFTFEGVQIVDALLVGVINAGRTQQDLGLAGLTVRYGITDRLEIEGRIPYVLRTQNLTGTLLNSSDSVVHSSAHGSGLGDIEGAAHYQFNDGRGGLPFFIGNVRYKGNTGTGPWDIAYETDGSAKSLPTGSGFGAINPSVTVIYPTEPAVLYGNVGWIHNFTNSRSLTINQTVISQIEPGDTYSGNFGIGVALNEDVSFSIGYEQDYIQATREVVNGSNQLAQSLLAGELAFGVTLKTFDRNTVNIGLNVGVTRDAPDVGLTMRTPFSLGQVSF